MYTIRVRALVQGRRLLHPTALVARRSLAAAGARNKADDGAGPAGPAGPASPTARAVAPVAAAREKGEAEREKRESAAVEERLRRILAEEGALGEVGEEEGQEATPAEAMGMMEAVRRLAEGRAVRVEASRVLEGSQEWKDYDSDVTFRLQLLRARYLAEGHGLTPARRQQLSAHMERTQMEAMREHARAAAQKLAASLTPEQKKDLLERARRVHPAPPLAQKVAEGREAMASVGVSAREAEEADLYAGVPEAYRLRMSEHPGKSMSLEEAYVRLQESLAEGAVASGRLTPEQVTQVRDNVKTLRDRLARGDAVWDASRDAGRPTSTGTPAHADRDAVLQAMLAAGESLARLGDRAKKQGGGGLDESIRAAKDKGDGETVPGHDATAAADKHPRST
jgi:hypothetical protein